MTIVFLNGATKVERKAIFDQIAQQDQALWLYVGMNTLTAMMGQSRHDNGNRSNAVIDCSNDQSLHASPTGQKLISHIPKLISSLIHAQWSIMVDDILSDPTAILNYADMAKQQSIYWIGMRPSASVDQPENDSCSPCIDEHEYDLCLDANALANTNAKILIRHIRQNPHPQAFRSLMQQLQQTIPSTYANNLAQVMHAEFG